MQQTCKNYSVSSLGEYLEIINFLDNCTLTHGKSNTPAHSGKISRLWYRGHEKQNYVLLPTLFRSGGGTSSHYGNNHLREDLRYQHFRSKCTQLVATNPESKIEWQEIMQHHLGKTRLMDWSESAISALMFAIEAFVDPADNKALDYRRINMTPAVWVLDPIRLNMHIYDIFRDNPYLINNALRDMLPYGRWSPLLVQKIIKQLKGQKKDFFDNAKESAINGIVCLSVIERERQANASRLDNLLRNEEFNPFFYLLLRYYSDGLVTPMNTLPPLAVVHPYHSNRIQSQHGVFTVVPHYQINDNQINSVEDKRPMERQLLISDCLYKISINRPASIAKELLMMGERRTSLYPDLEVYVKDIEAEDWKL